ncbi:nuclear transport factor 2 family protein [Kitasatospora sp. NPDC059747]|uniref:nuclear transport factor 2 family protein n=1 Tax=Kitasatospora sp. NPDC059747 TaxID=3346930 RepID=UPI00364F0862
MHDIEKVIDYQIEAYNSHDLNRFIACYSPQAVIQWWGGGFTRGQEKIHDSYAELFAHRSCRAEVSGRLVTNGWVTDRETVYRIAPEPMHVIAAYRVADGLIEQVLFLGP